MKIQKISIGDNGVVAIPDEIRMTISEIADLFGVFYQTAKSNIRAIQKSGVVDGDYSMGGVVEGLKVYPNYYGLDMIIAVAFRIQSPKAKVFINWLLKHATKTKQPIYLQCAFLGRINS